MSDTEKLASTPGSPLNKKRKPVPTPRSTLRKPSTGSQKISFINEEISISKKRNMSFSNGQDSQGETPCSSRSPDDSDARQSVRCEDGEDILSALEKIPGVGSLRSLGSLGSSVPSLTMDRVKRESSSHSLGPSSSGLLLERQRSAPTGTFHHTRRPWQIQSQTPNHVRFGTKSPSSPNSPASSPIGEEGDEGLAITTSPSLGGDNKMEQTIIDTSQVNEMEMSKIQERPLPELPNKNMNLESIDIVSSEQVYAALLTPEDHYCELSPKVTTISSNGTSQKVPSSTVIKIQDQQMNASMTSSGSQKLVNGYLTMTGTIRRGRHKPEKTVDIQLNLSPDRLKLIEKRAHEKYHDQFYCGLRRGPHVFVLSLLSLPFIWIYSTFQAFVLGSMTLFNIFIYYNEERTCCHTLLSPLVLLIYPIWIVPVTLFLGIYAAFSQVSWYWDSWLSEVLNPDKGFMNWVCQRLNVPDCAPYQVVVLTSEDTLPCLKDKPVEI